MQSSKFPSILYGRKWRKITRVPSSFSIGSNAGHTCYKINQAPKWAILLSKNRTPHKTGSNIASRRWPCTNLIYIIRVVNAASIAWIITCRFYIILVNWSRKFLRIPLKMTLSPQILLSEAWKWLIILVAPWSRPHMAYESEVCLLQLASGMLHGKIIDVFLCSLFVKTGEYRILNSPEHGT